MRVAVAAVLVFTTGACRIVGGVMPLNQPPLCREKLDAVSRWIAAGAKP